MNISLILVCIILETATQLSFKAGANSSSFKQTICEPIVWLGILLWAIEVALWMQVLKTTALTFAFPIMSLTYVITLIGSAIIFSRVY